MDNKYPSPNNYGSFAIEKELVAEKELVRTLLPKYLELRLSGKTNNGNKTAILISNTDGDGRYNPSHYSWSLLGGLQYQIMFGRDAIIFDSATSAQLREVVQNSDFGSIFVIGHADYHGWRASDKYVSWFELGQMVDGHLKNGIFANVGCSRIYHGNRIPLGYFVVSDPRTLIGYVEKYLPMNTFADLSKLSKIGRAHV